MELWRKCVLAALAVALVLVTVLTWGSLGSIATCFGLITMGSALLVQKYLTNRDEDDFQSE